MNKLDELRQKHQEMGEAIKRLEGNGGQWVPEINERYWFVASKFDTRRPKSVDAHFFADDDTDRILFRQGNMYRTEEEAEHALEMEKYEFERSLHIADVNRLIDEANGEWVADRCNERQRKAYFIYDHAAQKLGRDFFWEVEPLLELSPINPYAVEQIKSQLTQEQIDYIWRRNKPEGVK